MDYMIRDIQAKTNEILANQRTILDFINRNGQVRQNPSINQPQQRSFSTNIDNRIATPMPKMLNNTALLKNNRNDGKENHLSTISKPRFNNFQTPSQLQNPKPVSSTTVPRSQGNKNPVLINFLDEANKSAPKKPGVFPVSSANSRANLTLDTITMKKTLLANKKQEFDRNITVTSTPKRKIQETTTESVPSEKRKPGRPPKSVPKFVNSSSIVHQVKSPSVEGNNKKTIDFSNNNNKTLGSHLGIKTLLKCQICDTLVDTSAISEMVSHIWKHIIEKANDAKEVNSYYCETPECEFVTNSHDEVCFHHAESKDHNIVDNCATADEYFKHSLGQCFEDLDQKLAQNIYNLRRRRQMNTKK